MFVNVFHWCEYIVKYIFLFYYVFIPVLLLKVDKKTREVRRNLQSPQQFSLEKRCTKSDVECAAIYIFLLSLMPLGYRVHRMDTVPKGFHTVDTV